MTTLETIARYTDPAKRREYHRQRYLANRDQALAVAKRRKQALKILGATQQTQARIPEGDFIRLTEGTYAGFSTVERVEDPRPFIERDRRENMEAIRLRLIWASSAGGDEGTVAKCAVSVIKFAEGEGGRWTDRALRALHRRLSLAEGLTPERFDHAREAIARELFIPL